MADKRCMITNGAVTRLAIPPYLVANHHRLRPREAKESARLLRQRAARSVHGMLHELTAWSYDDTVRRRSLPDGQKPHILFLADVFGTRQCVLRIDKAEMTTR